VLTFLAELARFENSRKIKMTSRYFFVQAGDGGLWRKCRLPFSHGIEND